VCPADLDALDRPWPLEPRPDLFEAAMSAVSSRLARYVASLPDQRAQDTAGWAEVAARLREPVPEGGAPLAELLDLVLGQVVPCSFNTAGPGYLAYVPGGGLLSACAAELVAAVTNRFTGLWAPAPAAVELETQVLRWLATLMDMPDGTLGVFTTGGSFSTLLAAFAARTRKLGCELSRARASLRAEAHHCLP
jgi:aromatic-L-amino-acid decarboxylase